MCLGHGTPGTLEAAMQMEVTGVYRLEEVKYI